MPYRNFEKEPFDPSRHIKDRDDESYVRKSAIENDRQAQEEADLLYQEKGWFKKLFGEEKGIDIAHEEALIEHMSGLEYSGPGRMIEGKFHGIPLRVTADGYKNTVEGELLSARQGKFVFKRLQPLLLKAIEYVEADKKRKIHRADEAFTEKGQKAIGKLFGTHSKELREANTPPQLPSESTGFPKKEKDDEEKPE